MELLPTVNPNIVVVVHVIERTNTDAAFTVCRVFDFHVRRFHVIEVDADEAIFCVAGQFHLMPGFPRESGVHFSSVPAEVRL